MSIRVALNHTTHYKFDRKVSLSPHIIRLRPAPHTRTEIESYSMQVSPKDHFLNWQQDPFGNYLARLVFPEKEDHLKIEVNLVANLTVINPFDFFLEESASEYPFEYTPRLKKELASYLEITENGPLLRALLANLNCKPQHTIDFLVGVNQAVNQKLIYNLRMNPGVQTAEETLLIGSGSCRDFTWLMVQLFRHLGLAARFVSGYSIQLAPDVKPLEGPAGVAQDVTDLHAWVEVYIPGAGWIGLDATSGLFCTEGHIPLACVPNFESAAPIEGATDICKVEFEYSNTVKRLQEDPRVTKPYNDSQWAKIQDLGAKLDLALHKNDIRLTMGGEPTFVSIDDMESPEWNTAADGPHKRFLAWDLTKRLLENFGKGGLLHYAQGKWYPGEPLPRWAFNIFWRKDGLPVWQNQELLASPVQPGHLNPGNARDFLSLLSRNLGLREKFIQPAYEDIFYQIWEEGQIPVDIDPLKVDLEDPLERRTLAQILERGMGTPVGYVLPLSWNFNVQDWQSSKWLFRRKYLFLIPGNSPLGLRLPLESLSVPDTIFPLRSLFDDLPEFEIRDVSEIEHREDLSENLPLIKTAICTEVRNGNLYVFLPPLSYAEHYLELIRVIERTATELNVPVVIEGYAPPADYRIEKISVTPDPGVIEVNIHPSGSWNEMVRRTEILYEQARLSRLATEKFMVDGRHVGTGGGNHITMGAFHPADSPFLRRPDLLRSMITYWQHHPSLSYLFSSAFIGPTSQAPRIDETRDDRLYEIEIAFAQVPNPEDHKVPLWMVDRIFRNLLTDLTGNTHRAEFCIDKLYSPDSLNGRLGIVEMRGFEMPPHYKMSLVQMLLLRCILTRLWQQPYTHNLVRWGTSLYDKYLLPHYCKEDIEEVITDLRTFGYEFESEWLDPFFEFRFPRYGTIQIRGMEVEIRMAIEPWHVLGEELSNMGTARFVDSSLERVQVKITGMTSNRYSLLCNGCAVPLVPTTKKGEYVAGIRYRAWQPPSALHPTLPVDTPLVFDIYDNWNNVIVGGCTYHVSHPGGRAYETFPVNALEAESRRNNRFRETDNSASPIQYVPYASRAIGFQQHVNITVEKKDDILEITNPEFPYTLDLRWANSTKKRSKNR